MTKVKICGVTTLSDAIMCAEAGADLLGLNFYRPSPRYIPVSTASEITDALRTEFGRDCPTIVGVFVNENVATMQTIQREVGLDFVQMSGDESKSALQALDGVAFKGIRPENQKVAVNILEKFRPFFPLDERAPSILLDAYHPNLYGGTGKEASEQVASAVKSSVQRLMLAGGLNPENVRDRVLRIQPWGVDVASGVENGSRRKDDKKVRDFIQAVRDL